MNRTLAFIAAALLPLTFTARADEASEAKLKEQLKNALNQVRTLTTEKNTLMVAQAELTAKNAALEKSVKDQAKALEAKDAEMKDYKEKAETKQMEQSARITTLEAEVKRFQAALDKWQAANMTVTELAKKKETERAKLSAKAADLQRSVTDLKSKNIELYKLATEILTRYEQYGLGKALSAREPFTGNTKVKLQNIVQDYNDKILDQTAKP
jgi:chromosome segregation ATPase